LGTYNRSPKQPEVRQFGKSPATQKARSGAPFRTLPLFNSLTKSLTFRVDSSDYRQSVTRSMSSIDLSPITVLLTPFRQAWGMDQ
jgi:hypothetical protein